MVLIFISPHYYFSCRIDEYLAQILIHFYRLSLLGLL